MAQVARHLGSGESLQFAALVKVLTALDGGAAFASVEGKQVSTWDGGWWAVSTMTTVGYGDLYPHTDEGRAIAIMVMLVGIGFVAVLTASIAQRFVGEQVATAEMEIERDEAEVLAELLDLQRSCATSRGRSNGSSASR